MAKYEIKRQQQRTITAYLFLLPTIVLMSVFVLYPIIDAFILSFCTYDVFSPRKFIGLANYRELLSDDRFLLTLINSFVYLLCTPVIIFLAILLAVLVNREIKGISFFRGAFYLPVITSTIVVGIAWKWMFSEESGLINLVITGIGLPPLLWQTGSWMPLISCMIVTTWKGLGYFMVIFLAGLQNIPAELEEAATIDGANKLQRIMNITIPCLWPYITLCAILSSISALKVFEEIYIITRGKPLHMSETLVYYIFERAFRAPLDMGYASAMGVVLFGIILVFSIINLKFLEKGGPQA
jgi:putative chitobiose transport system permease protein